MRKIIFRNGTNFTPPSGQGDGFERALGYVVQWGSLSNTYQFVEISVHSNGQMAAAYYRTPDEADKAERPAYYMHGVPDKHGAYGFHS